MSNLRAACSLPAFKLKSSHTGKLFCNSNKTTVIMPQELLLLSCAKSHMLSASRRQPHLLHVSAVDRRQTWSMDNKNGLQTLAKLEELSAEFRPDSDISSGRSTVNVSHEFIRCTNHKASNALQVPVSGKKESLHCILHPQRRLCTCLCVCLSARYIKKLLTNSNKYFCGWDVSIATNHLILVLSQSGSRNLKIIFF